MVLITFLYFVKIINNNTNKIKVELQKILYIMVDN